MASIPESFIPAPSGRPACIAIFADTHGNRQSFANAIEMASANGSVDAALHLGDHASDAALLGEMRSEWPYFAVRGNNDYTEKDVPMEILLSVGKRKIYASHGHYHSASIRSDNLAKRALRLGADIAAYGHSHIARIETVDDVTIINPGSAAYPRDGNPPSFVLLLVSDDMTDVQLYHLARS